MDALQDSTLTYFDLTGRAEPIRVALLLGKVKFTDKRIGFPDWGALKPTTPWGSLPILELKDGTVIAQTKSILRAVGKIGGLYPEDPIAAAKVDELMDALDDAFNDSLNNCGRGLEKEAKEAARVEFFATGQGASALKKVDEIIGKNGGKHSVGDSVTIADIILLTSTCFLISGFWDGVAPTTLDAYKNIQATRKLVASIPEVAAYYEGRAHPKEVLLVEAKNL